MIFRKSSCTGNSQDHLINYSNVPLSLLSYCKKRQEEEGNKMSEIEFSKDEKEIIGKKIQLYFSEELDQDIGQFDASFLLDFIAEEIGPYFYNRGLYDAQVVLEERVETIKDAIYEIEKPTLFLR